MNKKYKINEKNMQSRGPIAKLFSTIDVFICMIGLQSNHSDNHLQSSNVEYNELFSIHLMV